MPVTIETVLSKPVEGCSIATGTIVFDQKNIVKFKVYKYYFTVTSLMYAKAS